MQLELSLRIPTADDRRTRLRLVAHAGAALVAAVLLVLFAATNAAAADDLGGLITETVATVEPIVEPAADAVEPAEPIVDPVVGRIASQVPAILEPVAPILDGKLPMIRPLLPPLGPPRTDAVPGTVRPGSAVPIDEVAPASLDAAAVLKSRHTESVPQLLDAAAVETALGESGRPFELPSLPSGPPVDAGTAVTVTFIAAVLIGLSMATPSGWDTNSLVTRLRPIGLTLRPPVPPG